VSISDEPSAEPSAAGLRTELDAALRRESELRAALVDAHRDRLESEDRIAARLDAALLDAEALRGEVAELSARCTAAEERATAEQVRRERLERLPPLRLAKLLARIPLLDRLRARRAKAYRQALAQAKGDEA
jgi:hypothetical protein